MNGLERVKKHPQQEKKKQNKIKGNFFNPLPNNLINKIADWFDNSKNNPGSHYEDEGESKYRREAD